MSASYRELVVWQKAMDLAVAIYAETDQFPVSEQYGLTSQMRRASVSIPSNIAEGYGRQTARQRFKFLEDALGSAYELDTQIEISTRLRFLSDESAHQLAGCAQVCRALQGLMTSVAKEARIQPRVRHKLVVHR
jgi:four helix bundle protein